MHVREKLDHHFGFRPIANKFPTDSPYRNCNYRAFSTLTYAVQACTGKTQQPIRSSTNRQQLSQRMSVQKWRFKDVFHTHIRCMGMYGNYSTAILILNRSSTIFPQKVHTQMAILGRSAHSHTLYRHVREKLGRHFCPRAIINNIPTESRCGNCDLRTFPTLTYAV